MESGSILFFLPFIFSCLLLDISRFSTCDSPKMRYISRREMLMEEKFNSRIYLRAIAHIILKLYLSIWFSGFISPICVLMVAFFGILVCMDHKIHYISLDTAKAFCGSILNVSLFAFRDCLDKCFSKLKMLVLKLNAWGWRMSIDIFKTDSKLIVKF